MHPGARVRHADPTRLPPDESARLTDRVGTVLAVYDADGPVAFVRWDARRAGAPTLLRSVRVADLVVA